MSYVADAAREALKTSGVNFRQSRRTLYLAAGVLALLHLLTVAPYIATSEKLTSIAAAMEANRALLAAVDPGVTPLADAGKRAQGRLEETLRAATDDMIGRFNALRPLIVAAQEGRVPPAASPADGADSAGTSPQQWPVQQMQMQQQMPPQMQLQDQFQQQPIGQQAPNMASRSDTEPPPNAVSPALHEVLTAVAEHRSDAYPLMTAYGRGAIVIPAYERAQRVWADDIRPTYTETLMALVRNARDAASRAPAGAAATAADLAAAAEALEKRRKTITAIEIRHDAQVNESLGSDWWFTVEGKAAYAGAVIASIQAQMDAVLGVASAAAADVQRTLTLQAKLQGEIKATQDWLKEQFTAQRGQLASLSGFGGALPVDLASFIGLFPLVLGLVLGLLMLRAAEERRQQRWPPPTSPRLPSTNRPRASG